MFVEIYSTGKRNVVLKNKLTKQRRDEMKNTKKKVLIPGIVTVLLLSTVVFAGGYRRKIDVAFNAVNIKVNGDPVKANNIVYKGTTYVPIRAVSEMLGKEVKWDQKTRTASINDIDENSISEEDAMNLVVDVAEKKFNQFSLMSNGTQKVNNKTFYVIRLFEDHPTHIVTLEWYYVDKETGDIYKWDPIEDELIFVN